MPLANSELAGTVLPDSLPRRLFPDVERTTLKRRGCWWWPMGPRKHKDFMMKAFVGAASESCVWAVS